jgi:hypothetical protein
LKDDFDNNDLWGIHVSSGNIVKIGAPDSDSSYIRKNLAIRTPDQMTLLFTPIIFEPGDSFILDFFVLLSTASETSSLISVGKIAGIKRIPVTAVNLNRRSLFYEAYLGDWEVLALRVLAAPIYIILFGVSIWAIIGPAIFVKSRFRRRRVNAVLVNNGLDLTNPAVMAIKERVGSSGLDEIENIIRSINSVIARKPQDDSKKPTVSEEAIETLTRARILIKRENAELVINNTPDDAGVSRQFMMRVHSVEEDMREMGILSRQDGKLKVNETACQALTVLAQCPNLNRIGCSVGRTVA